MFQFFHIMIILGCLMLAIVLTGCPAVGERAAVPAQPGFHAAVFLWVLVLGVLGSADRESGGLVCGGDGAAAVDRL